MECMFFHDSILERRSAMGEWFDIILLAAEEPRTVPADLYAIMKKALMEHAYLPGSQLPSENALAKAYGISRTVIRKAMRQLTAEGMIYPLRNRGFFAMTTGIHVKIGKESNYTQSMIDKHMRPQVKLLDLRTADPTVDMKRLFQLQESEVVWEISILRYCKGIPFVIGRSSIPYARFPEFGMHWREKKSLHKVFREIYGIRTSRKSSSCKVVFTDKKDSRLLSVFDHSPAIQVTSVTVGQKGEPVEHCVSLFRSDVVRLDINL